MSDLDKIFKAYDVRGLAPDELDEAVAEAVGAAFVRLTGATTMQGMMFGKGWPDRGHGFEREKTEFSVRCPRLGLEAWQPVEWGSGSGCG